MRSMMNDDDYGQIYYVLNPLGYTFNPNPTLVDFGTNFLAFYT